MADKGFFDVPRTTVRTSEMLVDLPILYHDAACRLLTYFVDHYRAASLLKGTGLVPCRFFNGKAMACLALPFTHK